MLLLCFFVDFCVVVGFVFCAAGVLADCAKTAAAVKSDVKTRRLIFCLFLLCGLFLSTHALILRPIRESRDHPRKLRRSAMFG